MPARPDLARRFASLTLLLTLALALLPLPGCQTNAMLREKGYAAINQQDWADARDHFAQAVQQQPNDGIAHYYLGLAELRLGDPLAAQLALERAYTLRKDDPALRDRILDRLGDALYEQGEYEKLDGFLGDIANQTTDPKDHLRHARYLVRIGDNDAAQLAYRKAAYFAPDGDAGPMLAIAAFYKAIGDQPNQRRALQYAYWINPDAPGLTDRLRDVGVVPGPTAAAEPPRPELLR